MTVPMEPQLWSSIGDDVRMALPLCKVACPAEEAAPLPQLGQREVLRMPMDEGQAAVDALEELRGQGCEYLIVPRTAFGWRDALPELTVHLGREYTLVLETENCTVH